LGKQTVALFQPRDHALDRIIEIGHRDRIGPAAICQQRGFIQ
jgi:hypothetical protein